jgi:hypothetical protein
VYLLLLNITANKDLLTGSSRHVFHLSCQEASFPECRVGTTSFHHDIVVDGSGLFLEDVMFSWDNDYNTAVINGRCHLSRQLMTLLTIDIMVL